MAPAPNSTNIYFCPNVSHFWFHQCRFCHMYNRMSSSKWRHHYVTQYVIVYFRIKNREIFISKIWILFLAKILVSERSSLLIRQKQLKLSTIFKLMLKVRRMIIYTGHTFIPVIHIGGSKLEPVISCLYVWIQTVCWHFLKQIGTLSIFTFYLYINILVCSVYFKSRISFFQETIWIWLHPIRLNLATAGALILNIATEMARQTWVIIYES